MKKKTPSSGKIPNRGHMSDEANSNSIAPIKESANSFSSHIKKCAACEKPAYRQSGWLSGVYHCHPFLCVYLVCPECLSIPSQFNKAQRTAETTVRELREERGLK